MRQEVEAYSHHYTLRKIGAKYYLGIFGKAKPFCIALLIVPTEEQKVDLFLMLHLTYVYSNAAEMCD